MPAKTKPNKTELKTGDKPAYESPRLLRLDDLATGSGGAPPCNSGTGNVQACTNGPVAQSNCGTGGQFN